MSTDHEDRVVQVHRTMADVSCPPFFSKIMGIDGNIDRGQVAEYFAPAFYISQTHVRPAGSGEDTPACRQMVMHAITPETRTTTHYFWGVARNFAVDDQDVTDYTVQAVSGVFAQDIEACEAIEHIIAAWEPSYPLELNIKVDAGPLRARRILEEMIALEGPTDPDHASARVDEAARRAAAASRARVRT